MKYIYSTIRMCNSKLKIYTCFYTDITNISYGWSYCCIR